MKYLKLLAVFAMILVTTACAPDASRSDASRMDDARAQLQGWLDQASRTTYGAAAGSDGTTNVQIEIPLERDGLSIAAVCTGAEGTRDFTINDGVSVSVSCGEEMAVQELAHNYGVQGNRLLITVDSAPAGSAWAIAAVSET